MLSPMSSLYLCAEEAEPVPEQTSVMVDANTQAAPAEQKPADPPSAEQNAAKAALAEPVNDVTAAEDTAPAEPANDATAAEDTAPAEPANDATAAEDTAPAGPVNDVTAAEDTAPAEPVNDAPAAEDTAPAEPANDATAADDGAPAESVNDATAADDAAPAEPMNDATAAEDTAPAEPVNDATAAEEQAPSESQLSDSVQNSNSTPAIVHGQVDPPAAMEEPSQAKLQGQAGQTAQTEAILQGQEDTAPETYSIILRNQIYGDTENAQANDLSARLILRINDIASLPTCPEDWTDDAGSYYRELVLKNMERQTIPGIPFSCPVWVEEPTLLYADKTEVQPALLNEGEAKTAPYNRSVIINGTYHDISLSPDIELNADGNQRGDGEYTLMWTANRDGEKPLYIINDSDTALSLSLDTESSSVLFVPGGSEQNSSSGGDGQNSNSSNDGQNSTGSGDGQNSTGSGDGQNSTGSGAGTVVIPAKGWGYLTVTPGNAPGTGSTGNSAADADITMVPLNVIVEKVIPSVGSTDSEGTWTLGQDAVSDGSYVVYRVKPLKTGEDDNEKTGDDTTDEDTPDSPNPSNPSDPKEDNENPPGSSEPDGKDNTPDQPKSFDGSPEKDKDSPDGEDLTPKPDKTSDSEDADEEPSKPIDHSSDDHDRKTDQSDNMSIRASYDEDTLPAGTASVDTADHTPAELYTIMMLIAGMTAAAMLLMRKKIQR